ncbi:membrane metallo-endopeptidase-like 1 [Dermacentor andersoni]|uniref:membrane metallo-endopeptidase-like 1 n=1 Tax=Dermacentor andersoni TaxID=34620 RepID=UPI002155ABB4|nr:membrane metallo-endopeptidase-like 1 [Dermacentor andersoni]
MSSESSEELAVIQAARMGGAIAPRHQHPATLAAVDAVIIGGGPSVGARQREGTSGGHATTVLYFLTASAIFVSVVSLLVGLLPWRLFGLGGGPGTRDLFGGRQSLAADGDDRDADARAPAVIRPYRHAGHDGDGETRVCSTVACEKEGSALFRQLEFHQEPCDDFYAYVCKRWETAHKLPYGAARVSMDDTLLDEYELMLADIIQRGRPGYEAVKDIFLRCEYPRKGDTHWLDVLSKMGLRPFPVILKPGASLDQVVKDLMAIGIQPLFSLSVERSVENPEQSYLLIGQPDLLMGPLRLGLDIEYSYLDDALSGFISEISEQNQTARSNVLKVERFLSASMDRHQIEGSGLNDELVDVSEQFPKLARRIRTIVADAFGTDLSKRPLKTYSLKYLHALETGDLTTNIEDYLNYLAFRTAVEIAADNEIDLGDLMAVSYSRYAGYPAPRPITRRRLCIRMMNRFEPTLIMHMSMDSTATRLGGKASFNSLLDLLESILNETLYAQTEFDKDFRDSLVESVAAINWEPIVPDAVTSHNELFRRLVSIYETASGSKRVIESYMALSTMFRYRDFAQKDLDKWVGWRGGMLSTYARLDAPFLKLEVPFPVFDFLRDPDASMERFQLPRVGVRVFYALYHGIYHLAYNYGAGKKPTLFVSKLHALMDCLGRQYAKLRWTESRRRIGRNSYYSNLLDFLALEPTYLAFMRYADRASRNERLPKLENLTPRQLFFVEYARNFCEVNNATFLDRVLDEGTKAPGWYRVNGPLRNFRPFADAFMCKPNSFMNPLHRCALK